MAAPPFSGIQVTPTASKAPLIFIRVSVVGDEYIRTAADTLRQAVRRGVDEVFRTNRAGDEFEVLIHGLLADPSRVAWSLLQRLADRGISASLGLAYTTATDFIPDRANLRLAAEEACRAAKRRGGSCGIVAGHGLVTAAASDLADDSGRGSHPNAWATPGAPAESTDAVPVEIPEGIAEPIRRLEMDRNWSLPVDASSPPGEGTVPR